MPKRGLTMSEGTTVAWLRKPGDVFRVGDPLFEVETEKTQQAVEADSTGILGRILVRSGEPAAAGGVVAEADET